MRRVAIATVFFGGAYTLWLWAYGGGVRRQRLTTVPISRQTPTRGIGTVAPSGAETGGANAPSFSAGSFSAGASSAGLASLAMAESSRKQAATHKAVGDAMKAGGDFAGAAKAYRDAALSAGVDKMFVDGRVGRRSEGGTEYHARLQRKQTSVVADPIQSRDYPAGSVVSEKFQPQSDRPSIGANNDSPPRQQQMQKQDQQQQQQPGRVVRGRARSSGLAAYKDTSERTYSTSHTKGTSGGRLGTVTAKGLASHVRDCTARTHSVSFTAGCLCVGACRLVPVR